MSKLMISISQYNYWYIARIQYTRWPCEQLRGQQPEHSNISAESTLVPTIIPEPLSHTHSVVTLTMANSDTVRNKPGTTQTVSNFNVHKLNIPVFSGEPLLWQSFWDCFNSAINSNPILNGVQKLNYLRAQLRADAAAVITGLPSLMLTMIIL